MLSIVNKEKNQPINHNRKPKQIKKQKIEDENAFKKRNSRSISTNTQGSVNVRKFSISDSDNRIIRVQHVK